MQHKCTYSRSSVDLATCVCCIFILRVYVYIHYKNEDKASILLKIDKISISNKTKSSHSTCLYLYRVRIPGHRKITLSCLKKVPQRRPIIFLPGIVCRSLGCASSWRTVHFGLHPELVWMVLRASTNIRLKCLSFAFSSGEHNLGNVRNWAFRSTK